MKLFGKSQLKKKEKKNHEKTIIHSFPKSFSCGINTQVYILDTAGN